MSCSLSVLKRSYVPGEHIKADVQLSNNSVRKSGPCRLQLKQVNNVSAVIHLSSCITVPSVVRIRVLPGGSSDGACFFVCLRLSSLMFVYLPTHNLYVIILRTIVMCSFFIVLVSYFRDNYP